ncbi:unnamed protein product [Protopolystoma xenopodis]|uniref:Uncharacterized protein n=1 Tax=Protopolystoma xenopodis TaxID=117903 RepID=A0A3S5CIS5_9PLAT|nr:unnamed protein product [Protopolystoma xenopodis]
MTMLTDDVGVTSMNVPRTRYATLIPFLWPSNHSLGLNSSRPFLNLTCRLFLSPGLLSSAFNQQLTHLGFSLVARLKRSAKMRYALVACTWVLCASL